MNERALRIWVLLLAFPAAVLSSYGQSIGAPTNRKTLAFATASVKTLMPGDLGDPPRVSTVGYPGGFSPGGLHFPGTSLRTLIQQAYGVENFQYDFLPSGFKPYPGWVSQSYFAVDAKTANAASVDELRQMFQTLLADRFHLQIRWVPVEMPAYTLELAPDGPPLADSNDPSAETMDEFTKFLSGTVFGAIVNQTGLSGKYINAINGGQYCRAAVVGIVPIGYLGRGPEPGVAPDCQGKPLFEDFLESHYHLKLVRHDKIPVDTLQIVRVERPVPDK